MKKAVVTLGVHVPDLLLISEPLLRAYAQKVDADFIKIENKVMDKLIIYPFPCFEKFQMKDMLDNYERIIYLDADILVQKDTPNLFDIVPETEVGGVYDNFKNEPSEVDSSNNYYEYFYSMFFIQKVLGKVDWGGKYFNAAFWFFQNCIVIFLTSIPN